MKAIILLATLKKIGQSNTEVLSEFFAEQLATNDIEYEIVKLVDHNILPGTYSNMGPGDDWPVILQKIFASQIIIFATPVWWGNHSSEMQKVIERLDKQHDEILAGNPPPLEGKVGGIIVTGDSDGEQHIIGNIANFFNAVGILLPPFATLTVQDTVLAKEKNTSHADLLKKFNEEYKSTAEKMVKQLKKYAAVA